MSYPDVLRALGLFEINENLFLCRFGCWAGELGWGWGWGSEVSNLLVHQNYLEPQQLLLEQDLGTFRGEGGGPPITLLGSRLPLSVPYWATLNLLIVHTKPGGPESGEMRG